MLPHTDPITEGARERASSSERESDPEWALFVVALELDWSSLKLWDCSVGCEVAAPALCEVAVIGARAWIAASEVAAITSALTPGYFDFPAGSSARRGAALAAAAVAAVRAVFDLRRS